MGCTRGGRRTDRSRRAVAPGGTWSLAHRWASRPRIGQRWWNSQSRQSSVESRSNSNRVYRDSEPRTCGDCSSLPWTYSACGRRRYSRLEYDLGPVGWTIDGGQATPVYFEVYPPGRFGGQVQGPLAGGLCFFSPGRRLVEGALGIRKSCWKLASFELALPNTPIEIGGKNALDGSRIGDHDPRGASQGLAYHVDR